MALLVLLCKGSHVSMKMYINRKSWCQHARAFVHAGVRACVCSVPCVSFSRLVTRCYELVCDVTFHRHTQPYSLRFWLEVIISLHEKKMFLFDLMLSSKSTFYSQVETSLGLDQYSA